MGAILEVGGHVSLRNQVATLLVDNDDQTWDVTFEDTGQKEHGVHENRMRSLTAMQKQKHGILTAMQKQKKNEQGSKSRDKDSSDDEAEDVEAGVAGFMKKRGLEAWYTHLSKHLNIKTIDQLKAITAVDLRRMGIAANMKLVRFPPPRPVPWPMHVASG